jgi:hypothetical protein
VKYFITPTPKGFELVYGFWLRKGASNKEYQQALKTIEETFIESIIEAGKNYILVIGIEFQEPTTGKGEKK